MESEHVERIRSKSFWKDGEHHNVRPHPVQRRHQRRQRYFERKLKQSNKNVAELILDIRFDNQPLIKSNEIREAKEDKSGLWHLESFHSNHKYIKALTGFECYDILTHYIDFVLPPEKENQVTRYHGSLTKAVGTTISSSHRRCSISRITQYGVFCRRFRRNECIIDIASTVGTSETTVSRICTTWSSLVLEALQMLDITIPHNVRQELVNDLNIKPCWSGVVLGDGTKCSLTGSNQGIASASTYNDYYSSSVGRGLVFSDVFMSPVLVSNLYSGSTPEEDIITLEKIPQSLKEAGFHTIVFDKGLQNKSIFTDAGLMVITPAKRDGYENTLSPLQILFGKEVSHVRIDIERFIQRMMISYKWLRGAVHFCDLYEANRIWKIAFMRQVFNKPLRKVWTHAFLTGLMKYEPKDMM